MLAEEQNKSIAHNNYLVEKMNQMVEHQDYIVEEVIRLVVISLKEKKSELVSEETKVEIRLMKKTNQQKKVKLKRPRQNLLFEEEKFDAKAISVCTH